MREYIDHPKVITEYLQKELSFGRLLDSVTEHKESIQCCLPHIHNKYHYLGMWLTIRVMFVFVCQISTNSADVEVGKKFTKILLVALSTA